MPRTTTFDEDDDSLNWDRRALRRDMAEAARELGEGELSFYVGQYYTFQGNRMALGLQIRALEKIGAPTRILGLNFQRFWDAERDMAMVLAEFCKHEPSGMAAWAQAVRGIGPVLAAGLLAHIDITKAPTVGHIWRFAGLDPTSKWEKGHKRPYNADLKILCFKIGESFVKTQNSKDGYYGKWFVARRNYENAKNERLEYADQARVAEARRRQWEERKKANIADVLAEKAEGDEESSPPVRPGMLRKGHIHARARRWTVKLFLAAWHGEAYRRHYQTEPPKPYAISILQHAHMIDLEHQGGSEAAE